VKFFSDMESVTALRAQFSTVANEFISDAVQNGDELAALQTQNAQRVMRLASVEPERFTAHLSGRQIKTVHKFVL
jgi:aspartyl/asparaginyl beta-hydroxylase (cupin superfamily)